MVVSVLFRVKARSSSLILLALVPGLGFGVFSCLMFFLLLAFGPSQKPLVVIEIALGSAVVLYEVRRRRTPQPRPSPHPIASNAQPRLIQILTLCFYLVAASSMIAFLILLVRRSHGEWDAWSIWNLKARYIFRGDAYWRDAFSSVLGFSHPDYPLMVPLSVAGSWILTGRETIASSAAICFLFAASTTALLVCSLRTLRSNAQGYLAGLLLLGSSLFIVEGPWQYADVPAGFFYLAAAVSVALYDVSRQSDRRLFALAGLSASLAAWTKNDGMLFFLALVVSRLVFGFSGQPVRTRIQKMMPFFAGAAPVMIIYVVFKALLAGTPNDILSAEPRVDKLLSLSRYIQVARAFGSEVWGFGGWSISIIVLLGICLAALGVAADPEARPAIYTLLGTVCIVFAGLFSIFIITPYDLSWHLDSTLHRLLLQVWPAFLFTFFLIARPPEETLVAATQQNPKLPNPDQERQQWAH
jgi:hypothetical protein